MVRAIITEMTRRTDFLQGQTVHSIYLGGGTPSLLSNDELCKILDAVHAQFTVSPTVEITLEANPDDLLQNNITQWHQAGINRLSVGIQSFTDAHLHWMNRGHTAAQAIEGIKAAQAAGITNISADLIFGFEGLTDDQWLSHIDHMLLLDIPHISAYMLTVEDKTALGHFARKGSYMPPPDDDINKQFIALHHILEENGYSHYEISNYAKPNRQSKHNTAYWQGTPYLGLGPSAHSYSGAQRMWNIANNPLYITQLLNPTSPTLPLTTETLTLTDRYNETIMTGLRTRAGIDLYNFRATYGNATTESLLIKAEPFIAMGWLTHALSLSPTLSGFLMVDYMCEALFE